MRPFKPAGTLLLAEALGRAMQAWRPEDWERLRPEARNFFEGRDQLRGFALTSLPQQAGVQECYDRLRGMLIGGSLPSQLRARSGVVPLSPRCWTGSDADRLPGMLTGVVKFADVDSTGDVVILKDDLDAVLAGRTVSCAQPSADSANAPTPTRDFGGKPPRHDLARFLGIAALIQYDSDPSTPAELRKLALDAYAATLPVGAEPPSDAWAKPHIRSFLEGYNTGGKRAD